MSDPDCICGEINSRHCPVHNDEGRSGRPALAEDVNDSNGFSEETCVRCGWRMGGAALNCQNDGTPHRFPSQEAAFARADRAEAEVERPTEAVMEALALVGQYADGKLDPLVALGKIGHKLLAARAVLAGQEGKPE